MISNYLWNVQNLKFILFVSFFVVVKTAAGVIWGVMMLAWLGAIM